LAALTRFVQGLADKAFTKLICIIYSARRTTFVVPRLQLGALSLARGERLVRAPPGSRVYWGNLLLASRVRYRM
jgi:hypothetical protein